MQEHQASTVRPIYPDDWALLLEADFDEYMERLYEHADSGDGEEILDASGTFFCGCHVCERRATWTFLMVRFIEGYRDGTVTLEEDPSRNIELSIEADE